MVPSLLWLTVEGSSFHIYHPSIHLLINTSPALGVAEVAGFAFRSLRMGVTPWTSLLFIAGPHTATFALATQANSEFQVHLIPVFGLW